ncbi:MAG TPA: metallophosphoesterase [Methanosarcina sp.]|nr:metallophosphoesterase [Methanosarcina sp.]
MEILTDEEFIQIFKEVGGCGPLAKKIGMHERAVYKRRKAIEQKYLITLHPKINNNMKINNDSAKIVNKISEGQIDLQIENGTVIIFSDAHFTPKVRTTSFRALIALIRKLKPKAVINNGDAFDGGTISRYPRIGWDAKPSVADELKAVKSSLDEIEIAAGNADLTWPLGNHDSRYETFLAAKAPEFQGVDGFHLKDHFPKWRPCWLTRINKDVVVKHRYKGGIHATHNNTVNAGLNIVTGHLHSLKVTPFTDYNGTRWGVDTGTLADPSGDHDRDYTECNPLNHRSGFIVLTFKNGQLLQPETVIKWDEDTVCFRGHLLNADTGEIV